MSAPDLTSPTWRKSTHSNGNGDCVEIAASPIHIGIRDTKNPSPHLTIPHPAWSALLTTLR